MIKKQIVSELEINKIIKRIASEIIEKIDSLDNLVIIGILSRGAPLAKRIANEISKLEKIKIPVGELDIGLYRDDLLEHGVNINLRETKINFDLNDKFVILVDDVLFKGRTIRAALDSIRDLGRPKAIKLAVLIDRGHRELPIQADFFGKFIPTAKNEIVEVKLLEADQKEGVFIKPS